MSWFYILFGSKCLSPLDKEMRDLGGGGRLGFVLFKLAVIFSGVLDTGAKVLLGSVEVRLLEVLKTISIQSCF